MRTVTDDDTSLTVYAGLGGIAVCCLAIELLGGAAILGGVAAAVGLSTGMTYLGIAGLAGVSAAGMVYLREAYR